MIAAMKLIRWIKVKLQETIKPNVSNKSKNILGVDRVEQFMQRRNFEVCGYLQFPMIKFPSGGVIISEIVLHQDAGGFQAGAEFLAAVNQAFTIVSAHLSRNSTRHYHSLKYNTTHLSLKQNALLPWVKVKGKGRYSSSWGGTPPQSYGMSLVIWDHTVLLATRHKMNVPCLTPAMQAGWYSIYLPPGDGRLSWPNWLVSGPDGSRTRDLSITSPTTNHCTTKRVIIFSDSLHTTLLNCTLMLPVSTIPTITVHCMAVPCVFVTLHNLIWLMILVSVTTTRFCLCSSSRYDLMIIPRSRLSCYGSHSFSVCGPAAWNSLPAAIWDLCSSSACFCSHLKT